MWVGVEGDENTNVGEWTSQQEDEVRSGSKDNKD